MPYKWHDSVSKLERMNINKPTQSALHLGLLHCIQRTLTVFQWEFVEKSRSKIVGCVVLFWLITFQNLPGHRFLGSDESGFSSWQPTIGENRQLISCRWTGRVWETTCRSSRLHEKITNHFRGIYRRIYPNLMKQNRRMSTRNPPVGLANTRISTDRLCPKISRITAGNTDRNDMSR